MSFITQKGFLMPPLFVLQLKRLRSKINIQKPKPPHHEKAKFLTITQPFLINPIMDKHPAELCKKDINLYQKDDYNPFKQIIAEELLKWFQNSRLIAFYHMNPMTSHQQSKAFLLFKKQGMHFKSYGKSTMELALKGTPYEAVLSLFVSRNMTVFSRNPEIKPLLKVTKKFPELILLAAIYENKFVSKDELMEYSLVPNLKTAQAGLVQTLNSIGGQVVQQLTTHQNCLVNNLQERIKQLEET